MAKVRGCFRIIALLLLALMAAGSAYAQQDFDRILSNSEDWKDVYSIIMYGNLAGKAVNFLVSDKHATLILNQIPTEQSILAVSSKKVPYVVGYKNLLASKGYDSEELVFENANLELAKRLTNVNNFIIVDDSYGYNAISVAPYAAITNSYVIFADRTNVREVDRFLATKKVGKLIIYGNVDREVKNTLQKYKPEIINKEGDRFLNNIEIVKKYQEIKHAKQAVLTNGEFIEHEVMSGSEPVLFIGTNNVPEAARQYVQNSEIQVGVLVGNELVGTATVVRRQMGISVFVKFAQGARSPRGAISQVEALDMYYLPTYSLNLQVEAIKFNKATNKLEVTIKNTEGQAAYAIGTYSLTGSDGSKQTVGDIGANFIDGNELKTFTYDVDALPDGDISVDIFIIYGESKGSLEKEIRKTMLVETVRVLDDCKMAIDEVSFNKRNRNFYVTVENTGEADCYVDMEIVDVVIAGERSTYGLDEVVQVNAKSKRTLKIKVEDMQEEDLADNEQAKVRAYYGERESVLVNVIEGTFELIVKGIDAISYALVATIVLLLLLILWKRRKKEKKEEPQAPKPAHHVPHATAIPQHAQQPQHPAHHQAVPHHTLPQKPALPPPHHQQK